MLSVPAAESSHQSSFVFLSPQLQSAMATNHFDWFSSAE
jgi:hypothetical protein